uniref:Uncharacterized protein n=1 Tax=Timema cristinae TaxID=61476 RepID=A0A7R9H3W8_TIMCR|nr:unnamed protein product [Timema cristinae]
MTEPRNLTHQARRGRALPTTYGKRGKGNGLATDGVAPHALTEVDVTSESLVVYPNSLAEMGTSETRETLSTEAASNHDVNNADRELYMALLIKALPTLSGGVLSFQLPK